MKPTRTNPIARLAHHSNLVTACTPLVVVFLAGCGSADANPAETDSALGTDDAGTANEDSAASPGSPSTSTTGDQGAASASGRWPNSGDFAEWYSGAIPNLPYVVGGQVVLEWADLDTGTGYDWTKLDNALSAMSLPTTLQINGSKKPSSVYSKVPYADMAPCSSWPTDPEVGDKDPSNGCLRVPMYWHPAFQTLYSSFLTALGTHLHSSGVGAKVVALRQNWNAIGTEHLSVPAAFQSASAWTDPPGVARGTDWSSSAQYGFEGTILGAHVSAFFVGGKAEPPVFVRTSLESQVLTETAPGGQTYEELFAAGKLAWFMTSAEMEPRQGGGGAYNPFLTYAATGKTLGLAEPWADAWGIHSGINDNHWASPPQFLYWRMLSDMQLGISYVDCYGDDLAVAQSAIYGGQPVPEYQAEFDAAFRFAAKYAGYAGRPAAAPGAFIAFRPLDPAVTNYNVADYAEFVSLLNAGATKGIDPRTDGTRGIAIPAPYGVQGNTYYSIGPTTQRFGAWARSIAQGAAVDLQLDASFRSHENAQGTKLVNVTYLDDTSGNAFTVAAAGQSLTVSLKGTGKWETATLQARGNLAENASGADIVVTARTGTITLHMVETTY